MCHANSLEPSLYSRPPKKGDYGAAGLLVCMGISERFLCLLCSEDRPEGLVVMLREY